MVISSQHRGKQAELYVFRELIKRGAALYAPVVDIGVDAVALGANGNYVELQVKATEAPDQDRYFNFYWKPKPNRFFICVSLKDDTPSVWAIPWDKFEKYAQKQKAGEGHRWHLPLPQKMEGGPKSKTREDLLDEFRASTYEDAWRPLLPQ